MSVRKKKLENSNSKSTPAGINKALLPMGSIAYCFIHYNTLGKAHFTVCSALINHEKLCCPTCWPTKTNISKALPVNSLDNFEICFPKDAAIRGCTRILNFLVQNCSSALSIELKLERWCWETWEESFTGTDGQFISSASVAKLP